MRLFAIAAIIGMLGLGIGWYTHVVHLADQTKVLKNELEAQQKGIAQLTETNRVLRTDHDTRKDQLNAALSKLQADGDCAHHALNWGNGEANEQ